MWHKTHFHCSSRRNRPLCGLKMAVEPVSGESGWKFMFNPLVFRPLHAVKYVTSLNALTFPFFYPTKDTFHSRTHTHKIHAREVEFCLVAFTFCPASGSPPAPAAYRAPTCLACAPMLLVFESEHETSQKHFGHRALVLWS